MSALCVVCALRPIVGVYLCRVCARSLDRVDNLCHGATIEWAARRARYFERRRALQPPTPEPPMPPGHPDTSRLKPLTPHARDILRGLLRGPVPAWKVNPGVRSRLVRGGLAEIRDRQLHITDPGRVELSPANANTTPNTPSDASSAATSTPRPGTPRICPGCRSLDGEHTFGTTCTLTDPANADPYDP